MTASEDPLTFYSPFSGARIGSILKADGSLDTSSNVFSLSRLSGDLLTLVKVDKTRTEVSGSSSYSLMKSSNSASTFVSGTYGVPFVYSVTANINQSWSGSETTEASQIKLRAKFLLYSGRAFIRWENLTPDLFLKCLNDSLKSETSPIADILRASEDLLSAFAKTETHDDPTVLEMARRYSNARINFEKNYGVGFVSGVWFGGGANVSGSSKMASSSKENRWQLGSKLDLSRVTGSITIGGAYGHAGQDAYKGATFNVESSSFGGPTAAKFAQNYQTTFNGQLMTELWNKQFVPADLPTAEFKGNAPPPLVDPKKESSPKFADKLTSIKSEKDIKLLESLMGFDAWRAENEGKSSYDDYKQYLKQQKEQRDKKVNDMKDKGDGLPPEMVQGMMPEYTRNDLTSFMEKPSTEDSERRSRKLVGENPSSDDNMFWQSVSGDDANEVIALTVTRWEDVLPGFSIERVDEDLIHLRLLNSIVYAMKSLAAMNNIAEMYYMAASFMSNDATKNLWESKAQRFNSAAQKLAPLLRQKNLLITEAVIMKDLDESEQRIFRSYLNSPWIFLASRFGMGGYIRVYDWNPPPIRRDSVLRIGKADRVTSKGVDRSIDKEAVWFTAQMIEANMYEASQIVAPRNYSSGLKFFPVISLDGEGMHLFVIDPATKKKGWYINSFFGSSYKWIYKFNGSEVARVKSIDPAKTEVKVALGKKELFQKQNSKTWTMGYRKDSTTTDLLPNFESKGKYELFLHLVPFSEKDLEEEHDWESLIVGQSPPTDSLNDQIDQLLKAYADGRNYWSDKAVNKDAYYLPELNDRLIRFSAAGISPPDLLQ